MGVVAGRAPLESALRKARWRILPLLSLGYLASYMDRANIGFAAESMNRDLHFTPHIYGLGAGLFFVSYALCEIPSNALLLRFGARRWLARIMLTWGLLAAGMMFVGGMRSFFIMRVLLGAAEAGYFPGAAYYISQWFPGRQRAQAVSWFYIAFPLSVTLMGAAAGSLLRLNGVLGLRGWQWLFLLEGAPAIALSVLFWFGLPEKPAKAEWLDEDERRELELDCGEEQDTEHGGGRNLLWAVFREPRVWGFGLFNFCMLCSNYAINFFLPLLIRELTGWRPSTVGYLIALGGLLGAAAMVLNAVHSDRALERRWHILVPVLLLATILLLAGLHLHGVVVACLLPMQLIAYAAMLGPMVTLMTEVCRGKAAALAIATINMCGIFGGFAGPYYMGWMRELTGSYAVAIGSLCVLWLIAAGCMMWLTKPRRANVTKVSENLMNVRTEAAE
jgi:ACS family tartrate transporter-like MFS transporter